VRILILNWRCPRNPKAGGAEIVTFEIARRLVADSHFVEWFASSFPGAEATEDMDGVRIVRAGRQWTVHWAAFRHYRGRLRGRFDVVIDQVNTIPFFTPLWADVPSFMFIHQLAREVWWYESRFPVNAIGYLLEPLFLRLYRRTPAFTESHSTQQDLLRLGFSAAITIVPPGLESAVTFSGAKCDIPTFLYVGRIAPSKRIEHILLAFEQFRVSAGTGQLWLVGTGNPSYRRALQALVDRKGLSSVVRFWGKLPTLEKHRLMTEAHLLLMASVREGWGLVVTEANALGTPAIVYDVPGLRDAVRNRETGLVVHPSPEKLAEAMLELWRDPAMYQLVGKRAQQWSRTFSFDDAAKIIFERIVHVTEGVHQRMEVHATRPHQ